jgi:hypothetical protein
MSQCRRPGRRFWLFQKLVELGDRFSPTVPAPTSPEARGRLAFGENPRIRPENGLTDLV